MSKIKDSAINPEHYRIGNKVQVIELIRLMPFSMGNSIKYCYRNGNKENAVQDLTKALWYLNDYKNHYVSFPKDVNKIHRLSEVVFSGLPVREREICLSLKNFYLNFTGVNNEFEENLYSTNIKLIEDYISDLS